jgi:energy-coupling factor transporter transmembrane protein EcfT
MSAKPSQPGWLAVAGTLLSLGICYGTLGLTSVLGILGIALVVNNTLWAGAIVAFALLAVFGLVLGQRRHRNWRPVLTGGLGAGIIVFVMYVEYDRIGELAGFVLLSVAALWDWRLKSASDR